MLRKNLPHNVLLAPDAAPAMASRGDLIAGFVDRLTADGPTATATAEPPATGKDDPNGASAATGTKAADLAVGTRSDDSGKPNGDTAAGEPGAATGKPTDDAAAKAAADKAKSKDWDKEPPKSRKEWDAAKEAMRAKYEPRISEFESKVKELEGKLTEASSELAKAREGGVDKAETERLKKEVEQLNEALRVTEVTAHPKFKAHFEGKVNAAVTLAKNIVGTDKAEEAAKLLSLPDGEWKQTKLDEFVSELSPLQQSRFGAVLNTLEGIRQEREEAIQAEVARAAKLKGDNEAATKARQQQARQQAESAFNTTLKGLQDAQNGNPAYQFREGDDAWNAKVEERVKLAKSLLLGDGLKPEQYIKATFDAAAMPAVLEQAMSLLKENTDLKAQVAKLTQARPGLPAGGGEGAGSGKPAGIKPGTPPSEARDFWTRSLQNA